MATEAHCAFCFESLAAQLEKRPALSLRQVEAFWKKYHASGAPTSDAASAAAKVDAESPARPAAISRLLSPASGSPSSAASTPSGSTPSGASAASSAGTSVTSLGSALQREESAQGDHPLFVTWNTVGRGGDKRLRGCIGTFEPLDLEEGLGSYALTSALDDTRFSPVTARELPTLQCAVTLLTDFEPTPGADPLAWTIGVHGIRLSFTHHGRRYGSTYLPDVAREQGWTKEEALISLMRKAGWSGRREDWQKVALKVVRYQGEKVSLEYAEWKAWRDWVEEEVAGR